MVGSVTRVLFKKSCTIIHLEGWIHLNGIKHSEMIKRNHTLDVLPLSAQYIRERTSECAVTVEMVSGFRGTKRRHQSEKKQKKGRAELEEYN